MREEEEEDCMPPANESLWADYPGYQMRLGENPEGEAERKAKWSKEALIFYDRNQGFDDCQWIITPKICEWEEVEGKVKANAQN
jgi:hypothetical protein